MNCLTEEQKKKCNELFEVGTVNVNACMNKQRNELKIPVKGHFFNK